MAVPCYLGRVLDASGAPVGTCFQVEPGLLVTAWHVLVDLDAGDVGGVVLVDGLPPGDAAAVPAEVVRVDPVHDLAVLRRSVPLPASVVGLVRADDVPPKTAVMVTGGFKGRSRELTRMCGDVLRGKAEVFEQISRRRRFAVSVEADHRAARVIGQ